MTYWLPWYNNVDLDTQLRFANVSSSTSGTYLHRRCRDDGVPSPCWQARAHARASNINAGPVKIAIRTSLPRRLIYKVAGKNTSFTEMMALPNSQLDMTYWLPWYNNKDLDTQLRFECQHFIHFGARLYGRRGNDGQSLHAPGRREHAQELPQHQRRTGQDCQRPGYCRGGALDLQGQWRQYQFRR